MRFKTLILGSVILLGVGVSSAYGLGIQLGPFSFGIGPEYYSDGPYVERRALFFDDPICRAIENRQLLEMEIEWQEQLSDAEHRTTIKKITIEPYLFGLNNNGQPILRGNIVDEKVLKEVTVKLGDRQEEATTQDNKSIFSGVFQSSSESKNRDIDTVQVRRAAHLRVIERSHFDPPKDFNALFKDDLAEVICIVTSSKE